MDDCGTSVTVQRIAQTVSFSDSGALADRESVGVGSSFCGTAIPIAGLAVGVVPIRFGGRGGRNTSYTLEGKSLAECGAESLKISGLSW